MNRIVHAFTDHMDVADAVATFYHTLNKRETAAKVSIYAALTLVCDALMVYRVFVVYEHKRSTIVVPSLLFLADIALAVHYAWSLSWLGKTPLIQTNLFYAVTLALNLLCTTMIAWKVWAIHRKVQVRAIAGIRIQGIVAIIVESAAIYSCILITLIVMSVLGSIGLWINIILDPVRSRLIPHHLSFHI
ncbi:uncharacterized protein PHACADRAFT_139808 [Phanerochaete carnosa HHB-10118-sp]|uniref:Uncharacterized protein n=1 Tax=Phanerochaete carnosa (strain HHB-10118-sp) TaxID=650164 RepID=K5X5L0_PHACS|nr:uncharacterized protein PHACADRAFT_139808 [Phanerochaete carnosa HHB-10118-sp]EKM58147.1 hypothetical protein PHACADRAFT_139808 [Phanerochaete carnosa HHB-10118-sp]